MKRFTIRPRPPVRAFFLGALVCLIGALFLVGSLANHWPTPLTVIFVIIALLGLTLIGAGVYSMRSMKVFMDLDDDGFHLHGPNVDKHGRWADITKVVLADDGARLIFSHGEVERTHLWNPMGADDPEFTALVGEVTKRLDASRGYTTLQ